MTEQKLKLRVGTFVEGKLSTKYVDVIDLSDARSKWLSFCDEQEYQRETVGGDIYNEQDEVIAIFSWNGRCWKPGDKGNEFYPNLSSGIEILV